MCFRKKNNYNINEKTRILNNNDLFNNYNNFKRNYLFGNDEYITEFNGIDIQNLIKKVEKYINSWFNNSNFKIMGSINLKNDTYYLLSDSITKNQLKVKYTLIINDPIITLIINEVIHSV